MQDVARGASDIGRKPSIPFDAIGWNSHRANPTKAEGCPCCGAAMSLDRPRVDMNTNTLMFGNSTVSVEPKEALLAELLVRRAPGSVTRDALIMYAWPEGEPEAAETALKVRICYLRRKAAILGLKIVNVQSVGYRMVFP